MPIRSADYNPLAMTSRIRRRIILATSLAIALVGLGTIVRSHVLALHDAFETDARIVHRLLSQRTSQHDAIMATLALLRASADDAQALRRLSAVYPQILSVEVRSGPTLTSDGSPIEAEAKSRSGPVLTDFDPAQGRYVLVQTAGSGAIAAQIDLRAMVPWAEWPLPHEMRGVHVALALGDRSVVLQDAAQSTPLHRFTFRKRLATDSQPFEVVVARAIVWGDLPWIALGAWLAVVLAATATVLALDRQQQRRRRAEDLLRLGQVARLNTLGELAAGMAHELNQPLAALSAGTQAARRLLDEDPPDLPTARQAMARAVEQASRAAGVLARLRRLIERPGDPARHQALDLGEATRDVLQLLEPELHQHAVKSTLRLEEVRVMADPVALEQIVHNLVMNAIQALAAVPASRRSLALSTARDADEGMLTITDSGPGISPEALPRLFEPFYTTRPGGLGLGLTLCESLAVGMDGHLGVRNAETGGAVFELRLPLETRP